MWMCVNQHIEITRVPHPCTIWAGESQANMNWLCELTQELLDEYTLRYGKKHASGLVFEKCKPFLSKLRYSKSGLIEFAQAMPDYNYKTQKPDWL